MKNFWDSKKVLVTGGRGFIGSEIVKELIKRGSRVIITTHDSNIQKRNNSNDAQLIKADLTNYKDCFIATKNIDIVLNFAAMDGGYIFKNKYSSEIFRTNTQIILNILEAAKINKVDRVLLMSSIDIYSQKVPSPVNEKFEFIENFNGKNFGYVWSKRFSEIAAKTYYQQYNLKIAIARAGNVYGPRDSKGKEKSRIIPTLIDKAIKGQDIILFGDGSQKKSFLYISDLAEALLNLTEKHPFCDPVNIASQEYISLKDLARLIINLTDSKSKIFFKNDDKLNKHKNLTIDTKKARKILSFNPRFSLRSGLIETINSL